VAAVICGEVDAYVHGGGFYEWDTAAPVAVTRTAALLPQVSQGRGRPAESGDDAASVAVSADGLQEVSLFGPRWVGHLGTNSFGRQPGLVAGEPLDDGDRRGLTWPAREPS
jgi:hypothetical protein